MFTFSSLGSVAAVGGIVALISAGWGHAKTVFAHLSSVLIVRGSSNYFLKQAIYSHLRRKWRLLPSNVASYRHLWMRVNGSNDQKCVPFRMPNHGSAIFVRKWTFIVFSSEGEGKFWGIRGLIDLDKMVADAVREYPNASRGTKRESQFRVIQLLGEEKSATGYGGGNSGLTKRSSGGDEPAEASSDISEPQPDVDLPLIYARSELLAKNVRDPFAHLFYEPYVHRAIESAETWFDNEEWYVSRGLPWRLGWLLSGPPGTGKSMLVQAISEKLGVRLYMFNLATMSDQEFRSEWANMTTPCVACFEDFDNVFVGRENQTAHKSLSFDTILNALSGVQTRSGVFLIVTTNHPEKLDSAMGTAPRFDEAGLSSAVSSRPGRLDVEIHLGLMGFDNRMRMADKMLSDWPDLHEEVMTIVGEFTPAQFQEICTQRALARIAAQQRARVAAIETLKADKEAVH